MLAERNYLVFAIAVAILIRIMAGIVTAQAPVPNEQGIPVSPLHAAPSSDLAFYQQSRELYFSGGVGDVFSSFTQFYSGSSESLHGLIVSAPIFPALLLLFDYGPDHTLPLALFFLVLSAIMVAAWLRWFHARSLPLIWLLAFAALPHPIWFTLNVGSDFLAALFWPAPD